MSKKPIEHLSEAYIYTDGSCNPMHQIGGWAVIVMYENKKVILAGHEKATTHQRMELTAVIKALEYLSENHLIHLKIIIYTDSQYVTDLEKRMEKLIRNNLITKKKSNLPNSDLIRIIFTYLEALHITFIKVKAHQKTSQQDNFNREVDMHSRRIVRAECLKLLDNIS